MESYNSSDNEDAPQSFSEMLSSLFLAFKERWGNPFIGTFILSWMIVNFELFVVLLGEGSFEEKLCFIRSDLYPDFIWTGVLKHIAYPLVGCTIYLLTLAIPCRLFYWLWRMAQDRLKQQKKEIDGAVILDKKESIPLLAEVNQLREQLKKEKDSREEQSKNLLNRLETLRSENISFRQILCIPNASFHANNVSIEKVEGNLEGLMRREPGYSWMLKMRQEKPTTDGFEIELLFESESNIEFESLYIDLEKEDLAGSIRLTDEISELKLYEGAKDRSRHLQRRFDLPRIVSSKRFSLRILGRTNGSLTYRFNHLVFYPPRLGSVEAQ